MKDWKNYVTAIREVSSYRNRIKSYVSDRNDLLDKGGQKNTPPYTKKMGSHVTFDKQVDNIGEEVEPESFDINDTLEPRIWKGEELLPEIRENLLKIALDFMEGLPVKIDIKDITLTGSLANYNWSNYSDFDLHIIVDFYELDANLVLVKSFFDNARMRWNDKHNILIKGYEVEVYVEDQRESHKSSGLYSIMKDEWIIKPKKYQSEIDFSSARRKADDFEFQVNIISNLVNAGKYKVALRNIDRLKNKIRNMRRAGLESKMQEFSVENIAFKILRRNDILGLLNDLKLKAYDSLLGMNGESDEVY
tara:strand:- start:1030 stop:1947 length:918 start_codon:yes stop_codon:yes gene_type:complete